MPHPFLNLAAYQFADLDALPELRARILEEGRRCNMRGTILLTPEGLNLMVSGPVEQARQFAAFLKGIPALASMHIKESFSDEQSFNRFLVKIKKETITFRQPGIRPADGRAATVSPETLARWLDEGHDDDGRDIAIIDTRNDFEVQVGHFRNAINPHIRKFTELPAALEEHRPRLAGKRVVTYCTGGIRCEKAALWMAANGYDNVVQLDGGVLDYFELTGGKHWDGELFVFDRRVSVKTDLSPGTWEQDFDTREVRQAAPASA
ncbi:MAG: rhodanese-like domain-containing protein [Lautropia sp.]|nr:rhodanese-like domain-containing protein [Lautropia sp.]